MLPTPDDPATPEPAGAGGARGDRSPADRARRLRVIAAGHDGDNAVARAALGDGDPAVWCAALGALARTGALSVDDVVAALSATSAAVRCRALAVAPGLGGPGSRSTLPAALRAALDDPDPLVAEGACFALGERRDTESVAALVGLAGAHPDTRCREAAVAALGAIGDPRGLPAVLGALEDKPTVRRRATVALSAFEGEDVEAGLRRSLADRDWQVREVAEILLGEPPVSGGPERSPG